MSYILEALKKSKQDRQDGGIPPLHVVHGIPSLGRRSRTFGRNVVLAGVAAVALCVGIFLYFTSPEKTIPAGGGSSQKISVGKIEIRSHFFEQAQEESVVVQDSPYRGAESTPGEKASQKKIAKDKAKKVVLNSSKDNGPSSSTQEFLLIKYRGELSSEIQEKLPQLVFAGHTYADDPRQRMIIINNTILREGDSIDADTRLVNIIWEGVVLEYKGVLFKQKTH